MFARHAKTHNVPEMVDWDDLRYFLAVARAGNLSAAAGRLGVTQPTVGRRIDAFELRLGSKLFSRTPRGYRLTPVGAAVLQHAAQMDQGAMAAERVGAGRDAGLEGSIRLSVPDWLARRVVAEASVGFRSSHPGVTIDVLCGVHWANLASKEADVALRLAAFDQQAVIARRVGTAAFGLYAAQSYLERNGAPLLETQCDGHDVVTMDEGVTRLLDVEWLARVAARARTVARTNTRESLAAMATAGAGLACLPRYMGDQEAKLVRLVLDVEPPARALWLGVHRDVASMPRIRKFIRFFTAWMVELGPRLSPSPVLKGRSVRPAR
jgi:DNA-binding transcriptional LysR family regulator